MIGLGWEGRAGVASTLGIVGLVEFMGGLLSGTVPPTRFSWFFFNSSIHGGFTTGILFLGDSSICITGSSACIAKPGSSFSVDALPPFTKGFFGTPFNSASLI